MHSRIKTLLFNRIVEIEFSYQPFIPSTWNSPGERENLTILNVKWIVREHNGVIYKEFPSNVIPQLNNWEDFINDLIAEINYEIEETNYLLESYHYDKELQA